MPRRVDLPDGLRIAPFTSAEADSAGVTRERLRSPDVAHPFHGMNVVGTAPADTRGRAEALVPLLRPGDAFSHTTAALLLGAPLPRPRDSRLHVTSAAANRIRRPGVVGHRAAPFPVAVLGGLPVVEPAHAWFQLATILGHDDLVAVGDHLVTPNRHRRSPALASIDALAAAIPARARGAGRARSALADVRVGPESRMETLLRLLLTRAGLPEPEINPRYEVDGRTLHPDLAYPQWGIVLEYEGDLHRTDLRTWRSDITRREAFESAGHRVIRVHAADVVAEPEAFLARVCRIIAQRRTR